MAERDLGNLCGEMLELTTAGHVAAYVCDRDRHSNGSHAAHSGDGSAVRWLSIDARAPLPIAVTERPSHLYSCPARVRDGVPCGCAMVAESVPPIEFPVNRTGGWQLTGWWRAVAPDGSLWCESSDEDEVRRAARPGDTVQRHERVTHERWMDSP